MVMQLMLFKNMYIYVLSIWSSIYYYKENRLGWCKTISAGFLFFFYKFLRITAPAINIAAQSKQTAWDVQFLKQDAPPQEK